MNLDVTAKIQTPTGWLELEDEANGYTLSADSFASSAVSHRKVEVSSEWMEGTFVVRSVRENVTETVSVFVTGATPAELSDRLLALTDGFDQLNYAMVVRFADAQETWSCQVADYTTSTKAELRHATMAQVTATVPRLPSVVRAKVYP